MLLTVLLTRTTPLLQTFIIDNQQKDLITIPYGVI